MATNSGRRGGTGSDPATTAGHEAGECMTFPAVTIPVETTVENAMRLFFHRHRFRAFPVVGQIGAVGLLTIQRVDAVPLSQRAETTVGEIVETAPDLFINEHSDVGELLGRPEFRRVGRAIVSTERGEVGILSMTEIKCALGQ